MTTAPAQQQQQQQQQQWIEIFHSKPSMRFCYLLEKLPDNTFAKPSPENRLRDASHIREGFRVFRLPFRRIEFVLTNGTDRNWEDNNGQNYTIQHPGRYVVEHGIRRVAEADNDECFQTICRPRDKFIQITFRADLWQSCYCSYQRDDLEWTKAPGMPMKLATTPMEGRHFEIIVEASRMACAFNDGADIWDSRLNKNYLIGCPGKYQVSAGVVRYVSASDPDLEREPLADTVHQQQRAPASKVVNTGTAMPAAVQ